MRPHEKLILEYCGKSEEKLYKVTTIAERYGINARSLRRWLKKGLIPAVRVGGIYLIRESDVESYFTPKITSE